VTQEQLALAQEKLQEIKKIDKFIRILGNGYINSMLGYEPDGAGSLDKVIYPLEGELREIVVKYLQSQLVALQLEFERL
jgi:hypothetical protein